MIKKPQTAQGYGGSHSRRVKEACLYLATKLGDLMEDMVVVGGLVPSLIIDQENLGGAGTPHVGTMDLDIGLSLAMVGEERYQEVASRLQSAGFSPDANEHGQPTRQRWKISEPPVTVDFLIEPAEAAESRAGRIFPLSAEWAAIIAPGLHLAFENDRRVMVEGQTILGEKARREIRVCGAGAFVVLKALAFHIRGENKDAYDLFYLLSNYGNGVEDAAREFRPLLGDPCAVRAMECLQEGFRDIDSTGPRRVAEFLFGRPDPDTQADAFGFVQQFLSLSR